MIPELRLFGGATLISADGQPVKGAAAQSRRLAVLAVLADAWPAAATRDRVIGLIWPEQDGAGARRLLTQALYEIRRELGPVVVGSSRDLSIDPDAFHVDLIELRRAARDGDLERAASFDDGSLLAGFHLRGAPEFERWLDEARESTRRERRRMLEALVARDEAAGRPRDAARWADRVVQLAPFDVDAVARAMQLSATAGDPGAAIATASAYGRRMREELELEPDPQIRQLLETLRADGAAATPRAAPPPADAIIAAPAASPPIAAASAADRGGAPRTGTSSKRRTIAVGSIAGVVVALGVALAMSLTRSDAEPPSGPALRIVPFTAPAGDTATERIARSVTAALAASLRTIDAERARGELRGQLLVTGGQLRIDAELRRAADRARPILVSVSGARDSALGLAERVAVAMLPALYPDAGVLPTAGTLSRIESSAALRWLLEGEAALRRGAFDSAFTAFARATTLSPTLGYPWYRRALAAEMAHRSDDADRSAAAADARSAELDPRERQLVRGYARWRAGDARGAETMFRELLRADSRDRDAWFHLAEIEYHAGPLLGRPVDESRDAWRRVVALDSGDYSALVHALRLEARAGDDGSVAALLRRDPLGASASPSAVESRVIAAYGTNTAASIASVRAELDTLPDYSLGFLQGMIAGLLERPAQAIDVARRLTRATHPQAVQAEGHLMLAHLAVARGRWRDAARELGVAEQQNPVAAAWSRAYFATLPFLDLSAEARSDALTRLRNAPTTVTSAPMSLQLAVDVPAAAMIEHYLDALLQPTGSAPALRCAGGGAPSIQALCEDLQRGLRAESLRRGGRDAEALHELEALEMLVPYQFAGRSMFYARSRERYLRAELLERAGRLREADAWYAAVPHGSWMDYVFLAPSHLRRGMISERLGDAPAAAGHYRKVLELWDEPDAPLMALRREAEAGLNRTATARRANKRRDEAVGPN